ncbi:LysM peptidoglycan-binding domain-containing protein [Fictibacillus sp. BK138]|uniref:LysM peptidoglycan-binding domain-containing protein n=1 Tax=Fictibacillus sp. BK138 TaxID=2512121 RepID=UPI0010D6BAC5|nr:LysM peptidoglycan-binding domain-containing protein [Fictibacillus sp. BK138]RZT24228.1 spore germination protein YaaH [Fictibacillus sp. BK138]
MKNFVFVLMIGFILSFNDAKTSYAEDTLKVGSVSSDQASIYEMPKLNSNIVTNLVKGEEYPILTQKEASASAQVHTVKRGDTFYLIAKQYGITVSELQTTNNLLGTRLYIGQQLVVPQETLTHRINIKDSLWKIARLYQVSADTLIKQNGLKAIFLETGQELKVPSGFYKVQLLEGGGKTGWIPKSNVDIEEVNRFNLGWKYNGTDDSYKKQLKIDGLDVVSPRWYTLSKTELISINADKSYANAAAEAGKQVWPLFGNRFDPQLTDYMLSDSDRRHKVIELIKKSLLHTKSQGINVDFENIDPKNKQDYVVFIRELKTALQPHDIVVSVDVSRENADPFWSGSLDRAGLGKVADFIVMMAYDEHWASSPKAGSVASIPWTREGIELLMKEVPAHKIVLGVPFYTREWVTNVNGQVRSIDRTILETEKLIQEKGLKKMWDEKTSQNYVEFMENGEKHQIWVEDKDSLKLRYDLVEKYHLRGTAAWYVGGASADIWNILK